MDFRRLKSSVNPAMQWSSLWLARYRARRAVSRAIGIGIQRMKAEPAPADGLARTLAALDLASVAPARRKPVRKPNLLRLSLPAGAVTGLITLSAVGWMYWIDIDPNVKVPTPILPSPNAFDYFNRAGQLLKDDNKVSEALMPAPQSAKPVIGMAGLPAGIASSSGSPQQTVYTLQRKEALVIENAPALTMFRDGLHYLYYAPPARSFSSTFPYVAKFRALARLLALEGQVRAAHGDWAGSVDSGLDAVQLGLKIPRGSPLIGRLVGIACEAIGRRALWGEVDHLNAEQARAAAKRLERSLNNDYIPYAQTLQEEQWMEQAALQEWFRKRHWRAPDMLNAYIGNQSSGPGEGIGLYISLLRYSKRQILDNYSRFMDEEIAEARWNYPGRRALYSVPELPTDPINRIIDPVFGAARFQDTLGDAQNRLLLTTLALRVYRLERGSYPQRLAELVPSYLEKVPEDPFSKSGSLLLYRRAMTKYLLYSVGPDRTDDHGMCIEKKLVLPRDRDMKAAQRFQVQEDSTGDIVAGENIYAGGQ